MNFEQKVFAVRPKLFRPTNRINQKRFCAFGFATHQKNFFLMEIPNFSDLTSFSES